MALVRAEPNVPRALQRRASARAGARGKRLHRAPGSYTRADCVAFNSTQEFGFVLHHGLAFLTAASASGARGGYRIALVRDEGTVIVGTEGVIDGSTGAAVSPGHLLASPSALSPRPGKSA